MYRVARAWRLPALPWFSLGLCLQAKRSGLLKARRKAPRLVSSATAPKGATLQLPLRNRGLLSPT
jgi:hypothetical protein